MNILVTGATGFIGTHLVAELRKSHQVFILGQFPGDPEKLGLPGYIMDDDIPRLVGYMQEHRISGIIHLASLYLTVHKPEQIRTLVDSNICFGTSVLEAASLSGCVRWFLNTGSIWQNFRSSSDAYRPVNLYAATKQAFIDMARYYTDVFGLRFCTLKLCDTYGPGDPRPKIFKLFKDCSESGKVLKMSPGEQLLDILYISDVVSGFCRLVELLASDQPLGEQYVLSSGEHRSLRSLAATFERVSGRQLPIEWGGRPYREREVMVPWRGPILPGWKANVDLETGIRLFLNL
ncbi:MAG: NAD-dependent epimerase/dehydratase family protein [Bacteroidales bacterium]|nr:NAD-dependent epimerase/dehydratase family protein [Bacteroidales bacterium]